MENEKLPISILSYCTVFNKTEKSCEEARRIIETRLTEEYRVEKEKVQDIIIGEQNRIIKRGQNQSDYLILSPKSIEEIFEFLKSQKAISSNTFEANVLELILALSNLTISETIFLWDIFCKLSKITQLEKERIASELNRVEEVIKEYPFLNLLLSTTEIKHILSITKAKRKLIQSLMQQELLERKYKSYAKDMRTLSMILSGTDHYNTEFYALYKRKPSYYNTNHFFENEKELLVSLGLYSILNADLNNLTKKDSISKSLILK